MRILYVVHGYKPAFRIGGPILSVSAAAESLVRKGHQVTVFTTNSNMDQDLDVPADCPVDVHGVEVWYFRRKDLIQQYLPFVPYLSKSIGFLYCPRMKAELARQVPRVDVVHTHLPFIYPTYVAAQAAFRFNKPLLYHQRGVLTPQNLQFRSLKKRLYLEAIEKPLLRRAATLIALTATEQESYRRLGLRNPCRIIPNGIWPEQYRQEEIGPQRLDISASARVILFMGRLHPTKECDKLIQAFCQARHRLGECVLVVAGPDEFGLIKEYREIVRRHGAEDQVLFPGMVTGELKTNLLARADLFCLPSRSEGFSMALLEALASATPVLISPGCHFPEVEAAGAGKIVPTRVDCLADALVDLLSDGQRLRHMGEAGLCLVRHTYSWDHITDQLLDVYRQSIEAARAPARRPGNSSFLCTRNRCD